MKRPKGSVHFYEKSIKEEQDIVITTFNGLLGSWDSFIRGICARRKWFPLEDSRKECTQEEAQLIIREEKMGATKDQALTIQRRSLKWWGIWRTQLLKNLLSILRVWIINDEVMNEEDNEVEGSRRILPMKQIKISIQLSFHDIILLCICLYSIDVLCIV